MNAQEWAQEARFLEGFGWRAPAPDCDNFWFHEKYGPVYIDDVWGLMTDEFVKQAQAIDELAAERDEALALLRQAAYYVVQLPQNELLRDKIQATLKAAILKKNE